MSDVIVDVVDGEVVDVLVGAAADPAEIVVGAAIPGVTVDVVDGEAVGVLVASSAELFEIAVGAEVGDRGPKGDTGPANTLTIGAVTGGLTAAATITGTAPNQILNLTLPKGDAGTNGTDGTDGREVQLRVTATHIQWRYAGEASWANLVALAAITGPAGAAGANGVNGAPGATGAAGPANTLSVGTVSSGTTASATITGAAPNQTINLVLPKGDSGPQGPIGPSGGLTFGLLVAFS